MQEQELQPAMVNLSPTGDILRECKQLLIFGQSGCYLRRLLAVVRADGERSSGPQLNIAGVTAQSPIHG